MMTQETEFLKAQQQFQHLCDLMCQAGREGWRLDKIERHAMPELMRLGLEFLTGHVEGQGNGDAGPEVTHDNRTLRRSAELHARRYLSIFGEVAVPRFVYAVREGQKAEYVPLLSVLSVIEVPSCSLAVLRRWSNARRCLGGDLDNRVQLFYDLRIDCFRGH